ncbi:MAG: DMT family transporter, partial [Candidatus Eremiobacterota bacterium]
MNGILAAILAAVLFGASTPLAKLLLGSIPAQMLAGLLYLGSGLGLGTLALARRAPLPLPGERLWLAGAVIFGGVLGPVLLMAGLASTPASTSSLLLNLEGVFTALLAWFVFRENFDARVALGMLSIVLGGVLLSWSGDRLALAPGALLVAAACLCWAVDNNLTQKVSAGDPLQIAAIKGGAAGAVNLAIAWALGHAVWPGAPRVAAAMGVGLAGYGVSLALFVLALRHLGTARTGAYFSL